MHIKNIHEMLEKLACCSREELDRGLDQLDADEFGKVTDMIKDLSEAEYYCKISKAMDTAEYGKDYDWRGSYSDRGRHGEMHDAKEGRMEHLKRSYMEAREMNKGNSAEEKHKRLKELENYVNELHDDILGMIADASPEEKSVLKTKLNTLANKIM